MKYVAPGDRASWSVKMFPLYPNVDTSYAPLRNASRAVPLPLVSQLQYTAAIRHVTPPTARISLPAGTRQRCPPGTVGGIPDAPQFDGTLTNGMLSPAGRSRAAFMNSTHWLVVTSNRPMLYS